MARSQSKRRIAAQTSPACGCGARSEKATGRLPPGTHAVAVDASIKSVNLKHLRRIEGQIRGIAAMVEDDRYCADIITQVSAVRESLHAVARNLMRNHLNHCAAEAMAHEGMARDAMVTELLELVAKVAR